MKPCICPWVASRAVILWRFAEPVPSPGCGGYCHVGVASHANIARMSVISHANIARISDFSHANIARICAISHANIAQISVVSFFFFFIIMTLEPRVE